MKTRQPKVLLIAPANHGLALSAFDHVQLETRDCAHQLPRVIEKGDVDFCVVHHACLDSISSVRGLISLYPGIQFFGITTLRDTAQVMDAGLRFGRAGIKQAFTVGDGRRGSYDVLRAAVTKSPDDFMRQLYLEAHKIFVTPDAVDPKGLTEFLELVFERKRVKNPGQRLEIGTSTLLSRLFRLQLPPFTELSHQAQLIWSLHLFSRGLSGAAISRQLDYSSNQSYGRTIRTLTKIGTKRYLETGDIDREKAKLFKMLAHPNWQRLRVTDKTLLGSTAASITRVA